MPRPREANPPVQAELRSLFRKLRTPLTRFLDLADQSSVDVATLLGEDQNGPDARLIVSAALFLAGVNIHRCPLLNARTIEDINNTVTATLGHEDGSRWTLGEPPDDGKPYETRIAPAGARWHRPMRPQAGRRGPGGK